MGDAVYNGNIAIICNLFLISSSLDFSGDDFFTRQVSNEELDNLEIGQSIFSPPPKEEWKNYSIEYVTKVNEKLFKLKAIAHKNDKDLEPIALGTLIIDSDNIIFLEENDK